jgi:cytochrome c
MRVVVVLLASVFFAGLFRAATQPGDEVKGKDLFARRCAGCHSLDHSMEGPALRNICGRKAGSAQGFQYSDALKNSTLVWDEISLEKWLTDPESLVPDNDMSFRVVSPDERRDIIAFLKSPGQ